MIYHHGTYCVAMRAFNQAATTARIKQALLSDQLLF
jgi:hypothetical protein